MSKQATLISDLTKSEDELWSGIKKNTKYEIRRAKKEGIEVKFYSSSKMPIELLRQFKNVYDEMYIAKGIKASFNDNLVKAYMKNDMIYFSVAYYQGVPLVFHSYIFDERNVRFYYSCSPFRDEREIATVIGRMNRLLHWEDWMHFKTRGIEEYDWGGINSIDEPNDIARFKYAFGGEAIYRYNYTVANGLIGKILMSLNVL